MSCYGVSTPRKWRSRIVRSQRGRKYLVEAFLRYLGGYNNCKDSYLPQCVADLILVTCGISWLEYIYLLLVLQTKVYNLRRLTVHESIQDGSSLKNLKMVFLLEI